MLTDKLTKSRYIEKWFAFQKKNIAIYVYIRGVLEPL